MTCPYCNFNGQNNCANVAEEIRLNGGTPGDGHCSNYKVYGKRAHFDKSVAMRGLIRQIFLKNGFTIKEGQTDLKEYVYDAAFELLSSMKSPGICDDKHYRLGEPLQSEVISGHILNQARPVYWCSITQSWEDV